MTKSDQKTPTQPVFEDYLKPSPFIQSWMLRFLPEDSRARDYIFLIICNLLLWLVAVAIYEVGSPSWLWAGTTVIGIGILGGDFQSRYMIAGIKFGQAKRIFREGQPFPDSGKKWKRPKPAQSKS
jgi:hypothetical protein